MAENSIFSKDYESQKSKLDSFGEPQDNIERSLYQYQCQMISIPFTIVTVQNIIAFFLLPIYLIKPYSRIKTKDEFKENAVFLREGVTRSIIPDSINREFTNIFDCSYAGQLFLGSREKRFIITIMKKYWYMPFFCFKCLLKIALYASIIYRYKPNAIIVHSEYSYTSSVLTEYCRIMGIEHINVMHGEKLFNIRDAFVKFDRFYVWNVHYIDLLIKLRSAKEQFIVEVPDCIKLKVDKKSEYKFMYTYYLGNENEKDLLKIKQTLMDTKIPLQKICIRYHPRYSNETQISQIFNEFGIQDPKSITLDSSISQTNYVISLYSTVLYQAYENDKEIIIDDLTDPEKYQNLKKLKYIMISKPHLSLSEVINS